jgi:hypothetical protein
MTTLKAGDIVRYSTPAPGETGKERFVVKELNRDRCFIQAICRLPFPPTSLARTADLVRCDSTVEEELSKVFSDDKGDKYQHE